MAVALSFGNYTSGLSTANGARPALTFGGDPIVDPFVGNTNLTYGSNVPKADTSFSRLASAFGLDFGTADTGTPVASVATSQIDGGAPFSDTLKGLAGAILSGIGAGSGDRNQPQVMPASYGNTGGIQASTLLLIGGAGLAVYWLAAGK